MHQGKSAIIIGAGPAGLTAAFELLTRTDIKPIIVEQTDYIGGISRTAQYKGNRIDIGGHRFFSKSDRVMTWWTNILPIAEPADVQISYHRQTRVVAQASPPANSDAVMLVRPRKSRIYFMRRFFDYPLKLSVDTLVKLGITKVLRVGFSYLRSMMFPIRPERSLQDFLINRFGRELYLTFFKSYTEKVWGVTCDQISAEWGAQRIKGLSIITALKHMIKSATRRQRDIAQKDTETSLIEQFLYPKLGPGQMWEEVARRVIEMGGEIWKEYKVERIEHSDSVVRRVCARSLRTGQEQIFEGDYFFSTMPVKELIASQSPRAPEAVRAVSDGLVYRDFITVGLLCRKLGVREESDGGLIRDNWIYVQEPDVQVGRLQIFNNWSPHMIQDPAKVWIGLEFFCYETDPLWRKSDDELIQLGTRELESIGILRSDDVLDGTVIRMPKTYPAYFGTYGDFDVVRRHTDKFGNLFLVGRNGMHKYNNQDHSMLTAMIAVDNIINGVKAKENLWNVNTEMEYHEARQQGASKRAGALS